MLMGIASVHAQYNDISCAKRPFNAWVVQVDQLENSTVFYIELQNDGRRYMNVFDDMFCRIDATGNIYHLLNSYNMPLSDTDNSRQLVMETGQTHRFALEFERMPLDNPIDMVELESNSRALNFYELAVDTTEVTSRIDYDAWVRDYPVKEYGTYVQDGSVIQYISYKGVTLAAHMQQTKEYGKYFSVDLDLQNNSKHDVLLDPARITATTFSPKKKKQLDLNVLSAEEYDKRVKRSQNWTTALVVMAGIAVTAAAVAADVAIAKDEAKHHPGPPPRHNNWRRHHHYHPYYPTDHYRSHYHSHDLGGLATATALVGSAAVTAGVVEGQKTKQETLEAHYIKPNTVRMGDEYLGYFNIKYEKTDNLIVNIPIMGENFEFRFQWQDGR